MTHPMLWGPLSEENEMASCAVLHILRYIQDPSHVAGVLWMASSVHGLSMLRGPLSDVR